MFPALCTSAHACYCGNAGVVASTNVEDVCKGVDVAVMLGGFPRKAGMERKDVMGKNVSIYAAQAAALEKHANKGVKVRTTKVASTTAESTFRPALISSPCSFVAPIGVVNITKQHRHFILGPNFTQLCRFGSPSCLSTPGAFGPCNVAMPGLSITSYPWALIDPLPHCLQ